jgi:hypothetical protein
MFNFHAALQFVRNVIRPLENDLAQISRLCIFQIWTSFVIALAAKNFLLEDAKISLLSAAGYFLAATHKAKSQCSPPCPNAIDQNPVYTSIYLRGMKRDEWVAPIPGLPCLTGRLHNH